MAPGCSVSVFMNIALWLKSWYVAEKLVFSPKQCRGGICTIYSSKFTVGGTVEVFQLYTTHGMVFFLYNYNFI